MNLNIRFSPDRWSAAARWSAAFALAAAGVSGPSFAAPIDFDEPGHSADTMVARGVPALAAANGATPARGTLQFAKLVARVPSCSPGCTST